MGWDIAIVESGDGGDYTTNGNDVGVFLNDENELYLRMFGGNVEADTQQNRTSGQQDFSYWGNGLLFGFDPAISFNSRTERTLKSVALNSQGRQEIENAITKDLHGLPVTVSVEIVSDDRIRVRLANQVTGQVGSFSLVRNPRNGDFDLNDFNPNDFF